jgi:3-hydroxyisobutyrate dehydrogenase-like beta-hydroxyacid dehydrogenase
MATVAILGAGLLGAGMVQNLRDRGQAVRVWNRSREKLLPLAATGATLADSPAAAVEGADRVHLVLTADDAVDAVVADLRPGLAAGVPVLDHSTNLPARVATRYMALRAGGIRYLHCPVFMAPANARAGTGLMLAAGPAGEVAALEPALLTMTGKLWHVGERPDLAAVYKLLGNNVLIGISGVLGDTLRIGAAEGLDAAAVGALFEHFNPAGMLPFATQRIARAGTGPASFALEMARKDVSLMLQTAGPDTIVLPAIAAAMDRAIAAGQGGADYAVYARPRRD